jgi:hypothetical protein
MVYLGTYVRLETPFRLAIQVEGHICSRSYLTTWYLGTEQSKYIAGLPLFQSRSETFASRCSLLAGRQLSAFDGLFQSIITCEGVRLRMRWCCRQLRAPLAAEFVIA